MRIAIIVGNFPILLETFILNQITGLVEQGHSTNIYTLDNLADDTSKGVSVTVVRARDSTHHVLKY